jgi:hypothetical protein
VVAEAVNPVILDLNLQFDIIHRKASTGLLGKSALPDAVQLLRKGMIARQETDKSYEGLQIHNRKIIEI